MAVKKWRVVKRGGEWVATSPPLNIASAYPSEYAIARVFSDWDSAMAYALNWIEGERRANRQKGLDLLNETIRRVASCT